MLRLQAVRTWGTIQKLYKVNLARSVSKKAAEQDGSVQWRVEPTRAWGFMVSSWRTGVII